MRIAKILLNTSYLLIALVTSEVIVDAAALLLPKLGLVGMIMQAVTIVILALVALRALFIIGRISIRIKSGFTLLVLGIWMLMIGFWAQDSRSLSGEATVETTCAINHLINSEDRGFHQTCLYGYPARQYLPQVFTSLVFGRSLAALSWGGSVYFLIGLVIFSWVMFESLGKSRKADVVTALLIGVLLHFKFVSHILFTFEQSIFPLSFSLILTGLGVHLFSQRKYSLIGFVGAVTLLIAHSYPPALVLVALLLLAVVGTTIKNPKLFPINMWLSTIALLSVVLSLTYRFDIFQKSDSTTTIHQNFIEVAQTATHLVFNNHGEAFFSPIVQGVIIVIFLSMLFKFHGFPAFVIATWIFAVIILSVVAKGYSNFGIDLRLHRSIVTIPPLLASLVYMIKPTIHKYAVKYLLLTLIIIITSGVYYSFSQVSKRAVHPHYEVIKQLKFFETSQAQSLIVTEKAGLSDNLISLHDTAQYFLPSITIRNISAGEIEFDNCARVSQSTNLLLILASDNKCLRSLSNGRAFKIASPNLQESYVLWKKANN